MATVIGAVVLGLGLAPSPAHAAVHQGQVVMDEAQALSTCNPNPAPAGGGGTGTVTYDDSSNMLSWNITFSNLSGAVTAAHFHGPAAPGTDAGIQVTITDMTSPSMGSATITEAQEADLLDTLYYVNFHTSACAGGEIRGQVGFFTVGGVAELPGSDSTPLQAKDSSGTNTGMIAGIAAVTAGAVLMATGAWYARRRTAAERR